MPTQPQQNDAVVLAPNSLSGVDADFLSSSLHWILTFLGWLIATAPGKIGYSYHRVHLEILARILISTRKAQPVEDLVSDLERNVDDYQSNVSQVVRAMREALPASPFAGFGPGALVFALVLRGDPKFKQAFNDYIDGYQRAADAAYSTVSALAQEGVSMETDGAVKLPEIRAAIDTLPESTNFDIVLKAGLRERCTFIELSLQTSVQKTRASAQEAVTYLQHAADAARKVERL